MNEATTSATAIASTTTKEGDESQSSSPSTPAAARQSLSLQQRQQQQQNGTTPTTTASMTDVSPSSLATLTTTATGSPLDTPSNNSTNVVDPLTCRLRRGDLVRVSPSGLRSSKRLHDREGQLGRILKVLVDENGALMYDVEWILGGRMLKVHRQDLLRTTADAEGMTDDCGNNRRKRKATTEILKTTNETTNTQSAVAKPSTKKPEKKKAKKEKAVTTTTKKDKKSNKETTKVSAEKVSAPKKAAQKKSSVAAKKGKGKSKVSTAEAKPGVEESQETTAEDHACGETVDSTISSSPDKIRLDTENSDAAPQLPDNEIKENEPEADVDLSQSSEGGKQQKKLKKSAQRKPSQTKASKKRKAPPAEVPPPPSVETGYSAMDLYERQRREFERCVARLEKVDKFGFFFDAVPQEYEEQYHQQQDYENKEEKSNLAKNSTSIPPTKDKQPETGVTNFPSHPPYNWLMVRQRLLHGRYVLDREKQEEEERFRMFDSYYKSLDKKLRPKRRFTKNKSNGQKENPRVLNKKGVDWNAFCDDVLGMLQAAVDRAEKDGVEIDADSGKPGTLSHAVNKIRKETLLVMERTGKRHEAELTAADDRHKFIAAIEKHQNSEAAMQSWRKEPFKERKYERLSKDVVCAGLSPVDEQIASFELRTSLPDSFIGVSYRYDDTGQSEAWMKSVVDETAPVTSIQQEQQLQPPAKKSKKNDKKMDQARQAALALAGDDGVIRAQVTATMQQLLIGVQDRVMTELDVLHQPELRSANWIHAHNNDQQLQQIRENQKSNCEKNACQLECNCELASNSEVKLEQSKDSDANIEQQNDHGAIVSYCESDEVDTTNKPCQPQHTPDIVEQPVWGMDCYTRRNITVCLEIEFDSKAALLFIEKWLLPAINACPLHLAHDVLNAARILEGEPLGMEGDSSKQESGCKIIGQHTAPLRAALHKKISESAPPWLKVAANQLKRARNSLGPDFFRVHPKGHGSVLLANRVEPNTLVTFYRGELYPSWRWGEKMDAIDITQQRKNLKPELPDFYNMALERPQTDPRGYGLLFVDASRKAGHGSSLSHSCDPTCEVRVVALNGTLCLSMTTIRELEMGEELTFDYNAVTESLNEYRSAVCLCGYGKCRGSFLHFATADCYQQVLNRNAPIASRFSNLVKGCMKQVMAEDDERVLRSHGFGTAAFGAISVNRRQESREGEWNLADSLDVVPVWLRTFVADTLRYIEYERRALPIALICDQLNNNKQESEESAIDLTKEPKAEPPFFFFLRVESVFLQTLLKKEGFPDTVSGKQRRHALQKVAANYWQDLPEEKKKEWKDKAQAAFEVKKKAWLNAKKTQNGKSKPSDKKKGKPEVDEKKKGKHEIEDVLQKSNLSFVDADAEGVSAMEQRIQHLTQTLSRVGRVLDRHREKAIEQDEGSGTSDTASLRKLVHSPIEVARDEQIVGWMWNSNSGARWSLMEEVSKARCTRKTLVKQLDKIVDDFSVLESFGDPEGGVPGQPKISAAEGRRRLQKALLELRSVLLEEVKSMIKAYRLHRSTLKGEASAEAELTRANTETGINPNNESVAKDTLELAVEVEDVGSTFQHSDAAANDEKADVVKTDFPAFKGNNSSSCTTLVKYCHETNCKAGLSMETRESPKADHSDPHLIAVSILDELINEAARRSTSQKTTESERNEKSVSFSNVSKPDPESEHWMQHYGDRFVLLAAADLLLFYAHTRNFFLMKPFKPLTSTPIEVYARELGNAVPRSAKDHLPVCEKGSENSSIVEVIPSHVPVIKSPDASSSVDNDLCEPDDIIAEVSITYNGDYVLAQLLQWYTGGIGQKPGLPDFIGCALLPRMSDCWSSDLLATNKMKSDRKTTYEVKVRPRLIDWLQDPYQRGNAWPEDVKKAFTGDMGYLRSDTSQLWLPFGSPILDFLVTGEEDTIQAIMHDLDTDDKVALKTDSGLLLSVDKGRPAQAVSNWVQCENPKCMKWRKIPWYVDIDLLPEKFYCEDNEWDPAANHCDAPEEDWDAYDKLVNENGMVEGSPVKKNKNASLSPNDESNFYVGARFDVQRSGKSKFTIGTVTKVDLSGKIKRIMFHYQKTKVESDEWIELGSSRIAPLYSKTLKDPKADCNGKFISTGKTEVEIVPEVTVSKKELKAQAKELKKQAKEMKKQAKESKKLLKVIEKNVSVHPPEDKTQATERKAKKAKIAKKKEKAEVNCENVPSQDAAANQNSPIFDPEAKPGLMSNLDAIAEMGVGPIGQFTQGPKKKKSAAKKKKLLEAGNDSKVGTELDLSTTVVPDDFEAMQKTENPRGKKKKKKCSDAVNDSKVGTQGDLSITAVLDNIESIQKIENLLGKKKKKKKCIDPRNDSGQGTKVSLALTAAPDDIEAGQEMENPHDTEAGLVSKKPAKTGKKSLLATEKQKRTKVKADPETKTKKKMAQLHSANGELSSSAVSGEATKKKKKKRPRDSADCKDQSAQLVAQVADEKPTIVESFGAETTNPAEYYQMEHDPDSALPFTGMKSPKSKKQKRSSYEEMLLSNDDTAYSEKSQLCNAFTHDIAASLIELASMGTRPDLQSSFSKESISYSAVMPLVDLKTGRARSSQCDVNDMPLITSKPCVEMEASAESVTPSVDMHPDPSVSSYKNMPKIDRAIALFENGNISFSPVTTFLKGGNSIVAGENEQRSRNSSPCAEWDQFFPSSAPEKAKARPAVSKTSTDTYGSSINDQTTTIAVSGTNALELGNVFQPGRSANADAETVPLAISQYLTAKTILKESDTQFTESVSLKSSEASQAERSYVSPTNHGAAEIGHGFQPNSNHQPHFRNEHEAIRAHGTITERGSAWSGVSTNHDTQAQHHQFSDTYRESGGPFYRESQEVNFQYQSTAIAYDARVQDYPVARTSPYGSEHMPMHSTQAHGFHSFHNDSRVGVTGHGRDQQRDWTNMQRSYPGATHPHHANPFEQRMAHANAPVPPVPGTNGYWLQHASSHAMPQMHGHSPTFHGHEHGHEQGHINHQAYQQYVSQPASQRNLHQFAMMPAPQRPHEHPQQDRRFFGEQY